MYTPRKAINAVTIHIPKQKDTLKVIIEGSDSNPTLLFIHGWPDTHLVWAKVVEDFSATHRCVRIGLPNYGPNADKCETDWGYDLNRISTIVVNTIKYIQLRDEKVTLVTHDWGAVIGWKVASLHPELIQNIVALDVSPYLDISISHIAYQLFLIFAFLIPYKSFGDYLTRLLAKYAQSPTNQEFIDRNMNYLYYWFWKEKLFGTKERKIKKKEKSLQMPILFVYGKNKRMIFHNDAWLKRMKTQPGCSAVGLDCGHWVMTDKPKELSELMENFLKERKKSMTDEKKS